MQDRITKYADSILSMKVDHWFGMYSDKWAMTAETNKGQIYSEDAELIKGILRIKIGQQNAGIGI